jgi:hypothetical protein
VATNPAPCQAKRTASGSLASTRPTQRRSPPAAAGPSNVAVTDRTASIVIAHASVPVQAPVHPAKVEPDAARGVSTTAVPAAYDSLQSLPQLMPAGSATTEPIPVPALLTFRA